MKSLIATKGDQRARPRRSRAEVDEILSDYRASGQSQVQFCRERVLSVATLGYWLRRSREAVESVEGSCLLPVRVRAAATELSRSVTLRLPSGLEVLLPAGYGVAEMAALVRHLEGTSC